MLTKEQEKKTKLQKQLSEEKTSNLSEKESRVMIVKKNDPRSQKQNGGMNQEDKRNL